MAQKKGKKKHHSNVGQVRIIGGDWRGRKLSVLQSEGLRPTSDRVRETLFNWLQFEIAGATCLDVFAGSGTLGLEALSRGAKSTVFLELSVPVSKQLLSNLETLKSTNAQVIQGDSLLWLESRFESGGADKFDVVFVDPPFHQNLMQKTVDKLFASGVISNEVSNSSWLYLEQEKVLSWPTLPDGWRCYREKVTSQVRFGLFKKSV
ncbi:16S rRNA (guanine(966)-N(2))-methyltransferase [hydrothermal vent metagenome]|uniref:16S rRNA (Guanine(966)-N(2))-methyltransferase n=1 Tax=hydrothermal vent metagenome TaxID=652676 RepID=A0A3B0WNB1_9ZZZZ